MSLIRRAYHVARLGLRPLVSNAAVLRPALIALALAGTALCVNGLLYLAAPSVPDLALGAVLALVLLAGALVVIAIPRLVAAVLMPDAGHTPIADQGHVVILGESRRSAELIEQFADFESRLRRSRRVRRQRIAVLTDSDAPVRADALAGRREHARCVVLRAGSALCAEHVRRVNPRHAAAIVIPAPASGATGASDERMLQSLMNAAVSVAAAAPADWPPVVAEVGDADLLEAARSVYPGPAALIDTPRLIARALADSARQPGLSPVYNELFAGIGGDQANQIFIGPAAGLAGWRLIDLAPCYDRVVLLGLVRESRFWPLYAEPDSVLSASDRLVFIARRVADCAADRAPGIAPSGGAPLGAFAEEGRVARRVLVMGWDRMVVSLLAEFDAHRGEDATVDVFSAVPIAERDDYIRRRGVRFEHAVVNQVEIDITSYAELAACDLASYDSVILVASGGQDGADARPLTAYLGLRRALADAGADPALIVETRARNNALFFVGAHAEYLVSSRIRSNLLVRTALERDVRPVIETLLGPAGPTLAFRPAPRGNRGESPLSFAEIAARCGATGEVLLGIARVGPGARLAVLNPVDKHKALELGREDQLIVLDSGRIEPRSAAGADTAARSAVKREIARR